jgi:hypothetical protein
VVSTSADSVESSLVLPALRQLHVDVVQNAVNSVPDTDTAAQVAEYGTIAQKFQSSGVNLVVAVGNAGNGWPSSLQQNQSSYTPRLIATDYNDLDAYTSNKADHSNSLLKDVLTAGLQPPAKVWWNDPAMKSCVATIQKAEPSAVINNPVTATSSTPGHLDGTADGVPAAGALHRHRQGRRQDPQQRDVQEGRRVAHPCHDPRWGRHLRLRRRPQ